MARMSVKQNIDARTLGRRFAEIVTEQDLPIHGIWTRDSHEYPEIWVVTNPLELEQMRPVYEARVTLRRLFPSADYVFSTVNPSWFTSFSVEDHVPADARRIELRE